HECDYPPAAVDKPQVTVSHINTSLESGRIDQQVRSQLQRSQSLYGLDSQQIKELAPDLIITQAQCELCAVHYDEVLELVAEDAIFDETDILALQPRSWDDVFRDILTVGAAVGCDEKANQLVDGYQQRIDRITETVRQAEVKSPRVVCVEWIEPLMVAGNWVPTLVEKAGGINGLSVANEPSQYEKWSAVMAFDPEVLIISPCGFDLKRARQELQQFQRPEGWQQLSAVSAGRVFVLDGNAYLNRSGPRLVETVEILGHLFHPHQISAPQLPQAEEETWYPWLDCGS
ncbi:MAG TPA: cobalamin-binding protein, partial [Planctomycetaceae bacterium]|nr:cobalamin-binding protein [Planctomycetaceae bacterium]